MKQSYIFLFIFLFTLISHAQIVNIPDANFKNALINTNCVDLDGDYSGDITADTNNDGEIQVSEAESVISLIVNGQNIASLNGIESFTNIELLIADSNQLTTLDFSQNLALGYLACASNMLTDINVSQNENLQLLFCDSNELTSLDVSGNPNLFELSCSGNLLTTLDLNANKDMSALFCESNQLTSLFIKNGQTESYVSFDYNPNIEYICVDSDEVTTIQNRLNDYGYTNCAINSYCTFNPGGDFYTVSGTTNIDVDNNGCEPEDPIAPYLVYNISNGVSNGVYVSGDSGSYSMPLQQGEYTIAPRLENFEYFTVSPTEFTVDFPNDSSPYEQDFCIIPDGVHDDLEIIIIPLNEARPGFDANYKLLYKNKGNTILSGDIRFTYAYIEDTVTYVGADPLPDSSVDGMLFFDFYDLHPFESREIFITMNLNTPTDPDFPLNAGDVLSYNVLINPGETDETLFDNSYSLRQFVVNSFDPNDIRCLEGSSILPDRVGNFVHYLIRFENTGTASAINIVVKDVIDTSKFDISTLIPLDSSHEFITRILNTNEVEFIFENINLPFDDANNDGYILFKIKTLETLQLGDTFENQAEIYFDFNFPIITNNYMTEIVNRLSVDEESLSPRMNIYPNPVNNALTIKSNLVFDGVKITDINGRVISAFNYKEGITERAIDLENLSSGVYFLTIETEVMSFTDKFVKN